jgi:hypothetical protein
MQVNALMDQNGVINELGMKYTGVTSAPASPSQSAGGTIKKPSKPHANAAFLTTGAPAVVSILVAGVFTSAMLALA